MSLSVRLTLTIIVACQHIYFNLTIGGRWFTLFIVSRNLLIRTWRHLFDSTLQLRPTINNIIVIASVIVTRKLTLALVAPLY